MEFLTLVVTHYPGLENNVDSMLAPFFPLLSWVSPSLVGGSPHSSVSGIGPSSGSWAAGSPPCETCSGFVCFIFIFFAVRSPHHVVGPIFFVENLLLHLRFWSLLVFLPCSLSLWW